MERATTGAKPGGAANSRRSDMASQNEHQLGGDFASQSTQSPKRRGRQRVVWLAIKGSRGTGKCNSDSRFGDQGFRARAGSRSRSIRTCPVLSCRVEKYGDEKGHPIELQLSYEPIPVPNGLPLPCVSLFL
jgi:hypothetical protein